MNNILEIKNLDLFFRAEEKMFQALYDINLSFERGKIHSIVGESGCGKTTTLRIIGGFVEPDTGDIFFDGKKINDLPPHKRQVNTVFQRYALF